MAHPEPPVYEIYLPDYHVSEEPDHETLGKVVDAEIKKRFPGQTLVVRALSSDEHPGMSADELVETIKRLGTDRYDPTRKGDRYENIKNKRIDFFAFRRKMTPRAKLFKDISWGFYHGAKAIHGRPVRIDILIAYDSAQLRAVVHQYEGRADRKRDGFVFKDPEHKPAAVKAIFKLTK